MRWREWWEVPGVVVEFIGHGDTLGRVVDDGIAIGGDKEDVLTWSELKTGKYKYKSVGVPFDGMPEWAVKIVFSKNGIKYGFFRENQISTTTHYYNNCPEGFKGKTFPVTEEFKKLLGVGP